MKRLEEGGLVVLGMWMRREQREDASHLQVLQLEFEAHVIFYRMRLNW